MLSFDYIVRVLLLFIVYACARMCIERLGQCSDVRRWSLHARVGTCGKRKRKKGGKRVRVRRKPAKLTHLRTLIQAILSVPEAQKKYKRLPTRQNQVSQFQPQATDCNIESTCSKAQFETFLQLCAAVNNHVDTFNESNETLEHALSAFIEEHFPFAEGVARCATDPRKVSCKKGHVHLRVKEAFRMPVNILRLTRQEIEQHPNLRRVRVHAMTGQREPTQEDILYVYEHDLTTPTTPFVQLKWNEQCGLDIKSHLGVSDNATLMPFSSGDKPVTRASCGGKAYDGQDAMDKCLAVDDAYFKEYKVMVRIFASPSTVDASIDS